jgi:predicted PurR-regulated permease PerM
MTKTSRKDKTAGSDDSDQVRPLRSPQAARWTLLVLTILALALLALIVGPFAGALFIAAVIAGAISPWYERLAARLRGRRQVAAGLTTAGILLTFFFAIVTLIVALVPAVGAGSVVLAAAAIMYLGGHSYAALFLVFWGILAVGLIDNVVKPFLIRGGIELHGAVVFFALLGGLAYFGPVGLIAGPLVVSFFLAVVRMWDRDDADPA